MTLDIDQLMSPPSCPANNNKNSTWELHLLKDFPQIRNTCVFVCLYVCLYVCCHRAPGKTQQEIFYISTDGFPQKWRAAISDFIYKFSFTTHTNNEGGKWQW